MTGVSTLGSFQAQTLRINNLQLQLDRLSNQLSTGKIARNFAELENDVIRSQRARADLSELEIYQRNLDLGTLRINLQTNALQSIEDQAELALNAINIEVAQGQIDLERIKDTSDTALNIVRDLLNDRDADNFLFAGTDVLTQPLNDTGTLETAVGSLLNDWQNEIITTQELLDAVRERDSGVNPLAITDAQVGYSTTLNEAKSLSVRADTNIEIETDARADEDQFRDILVALEVLRQLPQEAEGTGIDFDEVPDGIQNSSVTITSTNDLGADIFAGSSPLNDPLVDPTQEIQFIYDDPVAGPQAFVINLSDLNNDGLINGAPGVDTPDAQGIANLINDAAGTAGLPSAQGFDVVAIVNADGRLEIESDFDLTIDSSSTGPTDPAPATTLQFLGLDQDGGNDDVASFLTTTGDASTSLDEQDEIFFLIEELAKDIETSLDGVARSRLNLQDALSTVDRINQDLQGERVTLQSLISQVEDVDLNETAVSLQQVQFQLQASYQITDSISQLSLTNFLSF